MLLLSFAVDIIAMVIAMPRALFPEVADERFGGGAAVGWLFSAIAIGSVLGGLTSGWIGRVRRQGLALVVAVVAWGVAVALAGLAHQLWLMVVLLALAGAADLVSAVFRQSILQVYAPDQMRGRLQGVMTVVVAGGPRLGDLRAGDGRRARGAGFAWVGGGFAAAGLAVAARAGLPGADPLPRARTPRRRGDRTAGIGRRAGTPISSRHDERRDRPARCPEHSGRSRPTASEAVVVEVGGGLRAYRADGVDYLDGYAEDELSPGSAGQVLAPWPNRIRDGRYTFGGRALPAGADRAGPAQRDPRPGQLAALAAGRAAPDAVTVECDAAAAARLPVAAAAAHPVVGRRRRAAGRPRGDQHRRDRRARSGSPSTRTCGCPGSPSTT